MADRIASVSSMVVELEGTVDPKEAITSMA